MAEPQNKVRDVAWNELFPWLMLLRSVRIALMARVLLLGAAGLVATMVGWWVLAKVFSHSGEPVVADLSRGTGLAMWIESAENAAKPSWVNTAARTAVEVFDAAKSHLVESPRLIWAYFTRPFIAMFQATLSPTGFFFLLLCGFWELIVWGLFGGAITRIAALKFTRDEAPGLVAALKHAFLKWPSYSMPPLIAMAGAAVFGAQLMILGIIMRLEWLAFLAALVWPFVILLGLLMAILLIGALIGWPLMWATVSVEGTDAFDALSRSYAYTYQRPWRLLWYAIFGLFLAITSMFVVKLFASSAIALGNWSVDWGLNHDRMRSVVAPERAEATAPAAKSSQASDATAPPKFEGAAAPGAVIPDASANEKTPAADSKDGIEELDGTLRATRNIIGFWKAAVAMLVAGYEVSFLWVAAVGIYLLLRRDIDGVQTTEVFVDQAEEYGMPPLAEDGPTGVPEIAAREAALPGDTGAKPS